MILYIPWNIGKPSFLSSLHRSLAARAYHLGAAVKRGGIDLEVTHNSQLQVGQVISCKQVSSWLPELPLSLMR